MKLHTFVAFTQVLIAVAACSDDSTTEGPGGSSMGGSTSAGTGGSTPSGGGNAVGGSTASSATHRFDPAMTAGCEPWPASAMVPWVGMFFFGPDPGPCGETHVDEAGGSTSSTFQYDTTGRVTSVTTSSYVETYAYSGDLIQTVSRGDSPYGTFSYSADAVTYTVPSGYTAEWQLDTLGYPRRLIYKITAGTPAVESALYEYENCRLVRRTAEGTSTRLGNWTYGYDPEGHITTITTSNIGVLQEDYSCWP